MSKDTPPRILFESLHQGLFLPSHVFSCMQWMRRGESIWKHLACGSILTLLYESWVLLFLLLLPLSMDDAPYPYPIPYTVLEYSLYGLVNNSLWEERMSQREKAESVSFLLEWSKEYKPLNADALPSLSIHVRIIPCFSESFSSFPIYVLPCSKFSPCIQDPKSKTIITERTREKFCSFLTRRKNSHSFSLLEFLFFYFFTETEKFLCRQESWCPSHYILVTHHPIQPHALFAIIIRVERKWEESILFLLLLSASSSYWCFNS